MRHAQAPALEEGAGTREGEDHERARAACAPRRRPDQRLLTNASRPPPPARGEVVCVFSATQHTGAGKLVEKHRGRAPFLRWCGLLSSDSKMPRADEPVSQADYRFPTWWFVFMVVQNFPNMILEGCLWGVIW